MSHKLTVFLDKDGVINDGLNWANYTKDLLELLTYNDDIQVYWATAWFWAIKPKIKLELYNSEAKTLQEFYYWYHIGGREEIAKKYGEYLTWEQYKETTAEFYELLEAFYAKCKWHPMREKKTTILEVLKDNEPFLWIEDGNPKEEMNDIYATPNYDYFYVNLEKNPNQLLVVRNYINGKLR